MTFLITRNFFRPISRISFSKNVFVFSYSYMMTNFKSRVYIITFFTKVKICIILYINDFILIVLWYVLLYSFTISSNSLMYTVFDIETMYFFFCHGFLSRTQTTHRIAEQRREPSFILLSHFQLLTNIQTFICNFVCEMTITYF